MENQRDEVGEERQPVLPSAPMLEYRVPREERAGPTAAAVIMGALAIVPLLAVGFFGVMSAVATVGMWWDRDDRAGVGLLITLLALFGAMASLRTVWFYLGGWSKTPTGQIRSLFPWRWR